MSARTALVALAAGLTFSPACAQNAQTELGTLTCTAIEAEVNRFASEAVVLSCQFRDTAGGYAETYAGTLKRFVGAQPIDGPIVLIWTVSGEPGTLSPGILEQSYHGSEGGDPEDRKLQGRTNASIVLRPLAKVGETAEQTVTVLDLDLKHTRA